LVCRNEPKYAHRWSVDFYVPAILGVEKSARDLCKRTLGIVAGRAYRAARQRRRASGGSLGGDALDSRRDTAGDRCPGFGERRAESRSGPIVIAGSAVGSGVWF